MDSENFSFEIAGSSCCPNRRKDSQRCRTMVYFPAAPMENLLFHGKQRSDRTHGFTHDAGTCPLKAVESCMAGNLCQPLQCIITFQCTKGDKIALTFSMCLLVRYKNIESSFEQHRQIFERTHPRIVVAVQNRM